MMNSDDDDVLGIDLDAWQPPPPPAGIADRVIDRMRRETTQVTAQALPVEPARRPASKRWWIAGGVTVAAAATTLVAFGMTRPPQSGTGSLVATRAAHLSLGPSSAELDERTVVTWRRERYHITAQQAGGAAVWRVDDDDTLAIETAVGSIEATNASLRVEVKMLDDKKTIALSAVTAAAVAVVTIVVYEGTVKITDAGKTRQVMPGTAYQIKATGENVIEQEQTTVGAAALRTELAELDARIAEKEAELDELRHTLAREPDAFDPFDDDDVPDGLSRDNIQRTVKNLAGKIKACAGGYQGRVSASVRVHPSGDVANVTIDPKDAPVSACITGLLHAAKFDTSRAGGVFRYPFVFAGPPKPNPDLGGNPFAACDAYELLENGRADFSKGMNERALSSFEASYKCKADPNTLRLAFATTCKLHDLEKARRYWRQMKPAMRNSVLSLCVNNGIAQLDLEQGGAGTLQITNPVPAKVLLDGRDIGITPVDIKVPAGKHKVTLVVGAEKHTFAVDVKEGGTLTFRKDLE